MKIIVPSILAGLALAACAHEPVPADKLARTSASVRSAEELGAQNDPNAALHLRLAQEQVAQARDLIAHNDNERAAYVLDRAQADADAAREISRAKSSQLELQKTQQMINDQKAKLGGAQ